MTKEDHKGAKSAAFSFIRGPEGADKQEQPWPEGADVVRKALAESLNARNVAFLLGAGCSSHYVGGAEVGIPTMAPLAKEFTKSREKDDPLFPTATERKFLADQLGIDIADDEYARNLERLMELFYSLRFSVDFHSELTQAGRVFPPRIDPCSNLTPRPTRGERGVIVMELLSVIRRWRYRQHLAGTNQLAS